MLFTAFLNSTVNRKKKQTQH